MNTVQNPSNQKELIDAFQEAERRDALLKAQRAVQTPSDYGTVPRQGGADNYGDGNKIPGESRKEALQNSRRDYKNIHKNNWGDMFREKEQQAEKLLPPEMRKKLEEARKNYAAAKRVGGEAKTLVKSMTPWGLLSLVHEIDMLQDVPYFLAIGAAIFEDGLQDMAIGQMPGIGQVLAWCVSIFVAMMMLLGNIDRSEHDRTIVQSVLMKKVLKSKKLWKWLLLLLTTVLESIPAVEVLPLETICVLVIYSFALAERKGVKEARKIPTRN